jgi:hypothetical protein
MRLEAGKNDRKIEISEDDVRESYKKGHYIQAIVLTHCIIEVFMNSTYTTFAWPNALANPNSLTSRVKTKGKGRLKPSMFPFGMEKYGTYKFRTLNYILLDLGIYNAELFEKIDKFNEYRNIIVHKIFMKLPNKKERDSYFNLGMELWEATRKVHQELQQKYLQQFKDFSEGLISASDTANERR